jgi:hypothetical protein
MIKQIELNGKIKDYQFNDKSILKPFITGKRAKSDKEFVDIKNAINLRNSKTLECMMDDFGLKIMDEEEKGFCIKWEQLEEIRKLNNFHITDEDDDEAVDAKEIKFDKLISECLNLVVEAINSDR